MKCCIIGESGVGKTTLITSYLNQCFKKTETTLGALFTSLNFFDNTDNSIDDNTKHKQILQIWDTAGQERYRSLLPLYTRSSDIIILVFNVNNFKSINYLSNFIIKNNASINSNQLRPIYFLVGTHIDLIDPDLKFIFDKKWDYNNLDEVFKENINSINYFLVSGLTLHNLNNLFDRIKSICRNIFKINENDKNKINNIILNDVNDNNNLNNYYCCYK